MLSLESKFNEAVASLNKAGLYEKFNKQFTKIKEASIETKLNCALEVLKAGGIIESFVEGAWALTFAPKQQPIKKNNGAITESVGLITEVDSKKNSLVDHLVAKQGMQESEARSFMGLKAKVPEGLTRLQESEFRFARKCGISESDSLILCKMPLRSAAV